jgi:hypothetical protein
MTSTSHRNAKWRHAKKHAESFGVKVLDHWSLDKIKEETKRAEDMQYTKQNAAEKSKANGGDNNGKGASAPKPEKSVEIIPPSVMPASDVIFTMHHHNHVDFPLRPVITS